MCCSQVCVLGAGTMGHGIAQVAAQAGLHVVLRDLDQERLSAAVARIKDSLDQGVARGKVTPRQRDETLGRIGGSTSLEEAVAGCDLVIEAIPEDLRLKQETMAQVSRLVPGAAILATNTSALSVAAIASRALRPERVVGMHFFNPVHLMKLVEIIRHDRTSDSVVALAVDVASRMGKEAVVVKDVAGFASSRLGVLAGLEAIRMLEAGVASAADIDKAMRLGYGHPMGPLELGDHVGLDVRLAIAEHLERELGERFRPPELLRRMVASGKLGKKTGEGFYRWRDGSMVSEGQ